MQTYKVTVDEDKTIRWYNEKDQFHRLDGPAVEHMDGSKTWYVENKLHRIDGPAIEYADGHREWWFDGKLHRLGGPAIECANGDKEWWVKGKFHRLDGPAIEYANGYKVWFVEGKRHRLDGPAVEYTDGFKEWYVEGRRMTEEEFNEYIKPTCEGKIVEVDGIKYRLVKVTKEDARTLETELAAMTARAERAEAALTDPQQLHVYCLRTLNEGQISHLFGERMTEIVNRAQKAEERLEWLERFLQAGGTSISTVSPYTVEDHPDDTDETHFNFPFQIGISVERENRGCYEWVEFGNGAKGICPAIDAAKIKYDEWRKQFQETD